MADSRNFRYLNRDGLWPDFSWDGLELGDDGKLRLDALPRLEGDLPAGLATLPLPESPAGVAVGPDGTVYFTQPDCHRLLRIEGCASDSDVGTTGKPIGRCSSASGDCGDGGNLVPCIGGPSDVPGGVQWPGGVIYHALRHALVVADSGNHRLQLFDADTFQLQDIWGSWGAEDGQFETPTALAADAAGNVYVVDWGNQRVQKFDELGQVDSSFWKTISQDAEHPHPSWPTDVAVRKDGDHVEVFILDANQKSIYVVDADGNPVNDRYGHLVSPFGAGVLHRPMGLAMVGDALYVGDNTMGSNPGDPHHPRVLRFKRVDDRQSEYWVRSGEAIGYDGPVAALALDGHGGLLVHPGSDQAPVRMTAKGGYRQYGVLWGGPFPNPSFRPEQWHRLQAMIEPLARDTHFRLFFYRLNSDNAAVTDLRLLAPPSKLASYALPGDPALESPSATAVNAALEAPSATRARPAKEDFEIRPCPPQTDPDVCGFNTWYELPLDVSEGLITGRPDEAYWFGAEFSSEGLTSPALEQMRIDFDYPTLLNYLPAIYRDDERGRNFLARFLTLFESQFGDVENEMSHLAAVFDPAGAPADWLAWLGSWLALEVGEAWDEALKRRAIAEAFDAYSRRGTVEGLRAALKRFAGVDVRIQEPLQHATWWLLAGDEGSDSSMSSAAAENSVLEFSTMLAPAEAQGAVVGTTAVLDSSHVISGEDLGAPLFEDIAHQFTVQVYRGQATSAEGRAAVRAVIEREMPAHTAYHLCVVEPSLRIGFQARIGVDTVIAGPPPPTVLDPSVGPMGVLVLGGEPPGRVGERSEIGRTTRLEGLP